MSKKEKALMALIQQMQSQITQMGQPQSNPAQNYLTNEAMAGAEWMKQGEFGSGKQLPKGMFFDFQMPEEQINQYKKLANVNQGGTFALGDNGGMGKATETQKNYLTDKFARDASQNYQNNIRGAAGDIRGALGQAAGAKGDQDARIIAAMQGMGGVIGSLPNKTPWWQSLLQVGGQLGSAALSNPKF